ncbi:MAG: hypothetical protein CBC48_16790 [bacterium TMED88]|nr:hypothetical protein [Deltaproteobacteria bacterium]OUV25196.1 MAG: hypothetical protein CBC48_16790 [bacterium TMED88]
MRVDEVDTPGAEWQEFVAAHPHASLGHAPEWMTVLRQGYKLTTRALVARRGASEIAGVLPLALVPGLRGRRELVSLPYLDAAGILSDGPEAEEALKQHALKLAQEMGAHQLETRAMAREGHPGQADQDRVDLYLTLESDVDRQWQSVGAKVRNQTRKADKEGLELLQADDSSMLDAFYKPFCVNMRDLGSPVHGKKFLAAIGAAFGDRMRVIVTKLDDQPVGGLVAIRFGKTVNIPWASTLRSERRRCPNNQIYWEALRWSIENGAQEVDFGRSPREGGTHRFKLGWGAIPRELDWRRFTPDGQSIPLGSLGGTPVFERVSAAWSRLPVPTTRWIGPPLRRRISN